MQQKKNEAGSRMTVHEMREETGMSQSEFAAHFGIPTATLQDWEHKRRNPPHYVISMMERILESEKERKSNMREISYTEAENGARYESETGRKMDVLEEITKSEFEKRFPSVPTRGLLNPVYLENGVILLQEEWNGEEYSLENGRSYRPVYRKNGEDDYETIGFYEA